MIPVSEKSLDYAKQVAFRLNSSVDENQGTFGKKVAFWKSKGVVEFYVVGEKEAEHFKESGEMKAVLNKGKERINILI